MPGDPSTAPRPKALEILNWIFVLLVWAIYLLVVGLWELSAWVRGYAGRRRLRSLAFGVPLVAFSILAWKVIPLGWARFVLLDQASFTARRSEGMEVAQVRAQLRAKALRLGFPDIQNQDEGIEVEMVEEEGTRRCKVRLNFNQRVRLFRWTWIVPIRGSVDQVMLPKFKNPYTDENLE